MLFRSRALRILRHCLFVQPGVPRLQKGSARDGRRGRGTKKTGELIILLLLHPQRTAALVKYQDQLEAIRVSEDEEKARQEKLKQRQEVDAKYAVGGVESFGCSAVTHFLILCSAPALPAWRDRPSSRACW